MRRACGLIAADLRFSAFDGREAVAPVRWQAGKATPPGPAPSPRAQLAVGAHFSLTKRFSAEDVASFAALTGDSNPIHADGAAAAAAAGLPVAVLPGLLSASLFPAIIGSQFPGAVYLSQTLKFKRFALVGAARAACTCWWCKTAPGDWVGG